MATFLRFSKNMVAVPRRLKHYSHADAYRAGLASIPTTELTVADNNLKIATQTTDAEITTVGLFVDAGARYEETKNNGSSNLLTRLLFKGSTKRAQPELWNEIANLGAELKFDVTRDRIAIYGCCLSESVPKLVEIISDLVTNPKMSTEDLEDVRKTVLRESFESEPDLKELCLDQLHESAYQGTPLGQSVVGLRDTVKSITASDLKYYLDTHFKASRIVLAASGGTKHGDIVKLANQHLSKLDNTFDGEPPVLSKCRYTGSEIRLHDDSVPFAHIAMAVEGPGRNNPDYIPMLVAGTVIGSYDRSLGHNNDEESPYHICHSYDSFNTTYTDTGLFGVHAVCEPEQTSEVPRAIIRAWQGIANDITDAELNEAKKRLIRKVLNTLYCPEGSCKHIGNSVLALGHAPSAADLENAISSLSNDTIRKVADKYITNKCFTVSAVGPIGWMEDYLNLRSKMFLTQLLN